eukprot:5131328-Prymnesium_polylepis.1
MPTRRGTRDVRPALRRPWPPQGAGRNPPGPWPRSLMSYRDEHASKIPSRGTHILVADCIPALLSIPGVHDD